MLTEGQRDIASMGGQASSGSFEKGSKKAKEAGHKGGMAGGRQTADEVEELDEDYEEPLDDDEYVE